MANSFKLILVVMSLNLATSCQTTSAPVHGTLINNVTIIDGSGLPGYPGAIRIIDGAIAQVGPDLQPQSGDTIINGFGLTLAPGFIDTHSHHDVGLLTKRSADAAVSQGITTIVVGQDGDSHLPLSEFFQKLDEQPVAVNVASYAGHGALRQLVMGNNYKRAATTAEIQRMTELLDFEMRSGALGLSTGLEYEVGVNSTTDEVVTLAQVAARHGGRYISHIRSEDTYFWEALNELIEVGERAKLPVQVSHIKLAKVSSWGKTDRLIETLDSARQRGVNVTADIYPYTYWASTIKVFFPELDYDNPARAKYAITEVAQPDGVHFAIWNPDPEIVGQTLAEVANSRGLPADQVLMDLITELDAWQINHPEEEWSDIIIAESMTEPDIATLMQWPHTNICSDGADGGHPRGYGAFPRVLGHYTRGLGTLSIEEAIHKMTGLSAKHMGIKQRGYLVPGYAADMVLFDPERIIDTATIEHATQKSKGVHQVWVNGISVYKDNRVMNRFPGRAIKRQTQNER